jgi:hypothetical protein
MLRQSPSLASRPQDPEPDVLDATSLRPDPEFTPTDRRHLCVAFLVALTIGILYIFFTPPGTPYDEPSHFVTVQYYASHRQMPVLGQPGVSYEAQMGPIYYTIAACVYSVSHFAGARASFYLMRFLDLLLMLPLQYLTYRIVQFTVPGRRGLPLAAAVFTGLCPALLAIAASIQNDLLTMVFAYWAILTTWRTLNVERPSPASAVPVALIVSLAMLTKLTAAFLVPALILYALYRHRTQGLAWLAAFGATVALCTGWWFARNIALYGDLTGSAGLRRFGYKNLGGPLRIDQLPHSQSFLRDIVGSFWLPNGYYRNLFHLTQPEVAFMGVLLTLLGALAVASAFFPRQSGLLPRAPFRLNTKVFFTCLGGASAAIFILMCFGVGIVAVRTTFPIFFLFALAMNAGGLEFVRKYGQHERKWIVGMASVLILLSFLTFRHIHVVPLMGFNYLFD